MAAQAREVPGIEGGEVLVACSRENFEKNKADPSALRSLCATEVVARNLFEMPLAMLVADASADKGRLHLGGYRCVLAGVVNMFPHTAHVESMAVFELENGSS